jgi:hypothetical protein
MDVSRRCALENGTIVSPGQEMVESKSTSFSRSFKLGISAFIGALIEGGCALLMLTNTCKILLGLGSTAFAVRSSFLHSDVVRWPVMIASAGTATVVLYAVWNGWRLRRNPAARWRQKPLTRREKWSIRISVASALLSWALVIGEYFAHPIVHRH